jgi:NhaA family Na+:H+ antiporter
MRNSKIRRYQFFDNESAGGMLLIFAALLAMIVANTPLVKYYNMLIDLPVEVRVGTFEIAKPLLLWINDGLMAFFFLAVGLELKREIVIGELSKPGKIALPLLGAVGGMVLPALIYILFNYDDPVALQGWAIPSATDIAFALGILTLLGKRVPIGLRLFLASLAIFDDLGAIVIIALFYTHDLSLTALSVAGAMVAVLYLLNRRGVTELTTYFIVGLILWVAVLKSGVHATLAGVLLAFFIPLRSSKSEDAERSPLKELEHDLDKSVTYLILPLFAFANAGISFSGMRWEAFVHPVPLGIALGLFLGKQTGIFLFSWIGIRLKWASLPYGMDWRILYGASVLAGIGFTMSLFIASLAFDKSGVNQIFDERLGIITGSLFSGLFGYWILKRALNRQQQMHRSHPDLSDRH